ncbi:Uncharacterized membrane-anchored protein [Novosphingobium sp. CF614]|uniref:DUF3422 domain-containing protein n=1 Tax=Novosphingobium sp. CF614 TaxID=1884364 RepID=UPI0008E8D581|nr:DUF3422 domain-containing protein [Novosphingobium sp. CF614]SFG28910.1 Uncharacterized membrane-anchored protein [Novosphingobium sp. CF614]
MEKDILREHASRREIVGEMHLRRWPTIEPPTLVIQILRLVSENERISAREMLASLPAGSRVTDTDNPKHLVGELPGGTAFVWEAHTEASAFTFFTPIADPADLIGSALDSSTAAALEWAKHLQGETIRATRMAIVSDDAAATPVVDALGLTETDLVSCHIGAGARVWTDFRIDREGFGRMVIAANGTGARDLTRLAQRVQELGNYRNLALLGLPAAHASWAVLNQVEGTLRELSGDVSRPEITDDILLQRVSGLSLDLMSISVGTGYRMSATQAYAQLVEERLAELSPRAIAGFQSLTDFTERRLLPAVRTCAAHTRRVADLSERTASFTSLLRARIETRIENQNARLLESMERSSSLQLRLQQLVEGLSVVALSYYCIGLLGYVLKGIEAADGRFHAPEILALATPLVVISAAMALHRVKRRLFVSV